MSPDLTQATSRGDGAHRRRSPWRTVALVAGGFVVVAACGGGGGDSDATEAPAPTSAPTTGAPTTVATSAAPTTVATTIPATDPVVTDPVATEPPPTTLDPVALDAQIRADFERTWVAYFDCVSEPDTCPFGAINLLASPLDDALRATVDELLRNNLRSRPGSGPVEVSIENVTVISPSEADIEVCLTDGAVLFDIQDPQNPADDVIVNDALNSYRNVYRMKLSEGRWLRFSGEQLQVFAGVPACAE